MYTVVVNPDRDEMLRRLRALMSGRPEILEAYLFGSVARSSAQPHSDVDIAVYVDEAKLPDAPFGYEAALSAECIKALGTNRVDVVRLNRAGPLLYHRVLRDGCRFLARDIQATTTREGYALSRYCDYVPQLAKLERTAARRIRAGEFGQ